MIRIRHSKTRLRHDSRTLAMQGSPERGDGLDHGKWYRCWNCKMPNHIERDALGDMYSTDGVALTDYAQQPATNSIREARLGDALVVSNDDTIKHPLMVSESSRGCRFCHSLNWKGDYP